MRRFFLVLMLVAMAMSAVGQTPTPTPIPLSQSLNNLGSAISLTGTESFVVIQSNLGKKATATLVSNIFQPLDPDLTAIAALSTTAFGRSLLTTADAAALRIAGGLVIGTNVQAFDSDLQALAALSGTNVIYYRVGPGNWAPVGMGSGLSFVGGILSSTVTPSGTVWGGITGTLADQIDLQTALDEKLGTTGNASGLTGLTDGQIPSSIARDSEVAAGYQPLDTDLTSIAGLVTTPFGRGLLTQADATATRSILGLVIGTNVQGFDTDLSLYAGITPSANVQAFLGAANYAAMRTQLALVVGTNVQAFDADLTTYAGITPGADVQTFLSAVDYAAMRIQLDLVIGSNIQPFDTDLNTYAGIPPSSNVQSFLGAATYAAMRSQLGLVVGTDVLAPTGSGASLTGITGTQAVFSDPDNKYVAANVTAAIAELDNAGTGPNALDGKVAWGQLVNMPSGFADGVDDSGAAGGSGTVNVVKENNLTVGGPTITTLDFLGADFDLTETPTNEINIAIAGAIARDAEVAAVYAPLASPTFTGTVTAPTFSGALSGNATSATTATSASTLTTPRLIGNVSFSGAADIVPQTTQVVDSTDATSSIAMFDSATGNLQVKTDGGLTYNATTGMLIATGFTGPLTGNASTATTATTANAGDSATAFFTTGQIERARGGTGADTSAYGNGLLGSDGTNVTIDVDSIGEFTTALGTTGTPSATTYLRGDNSWQTIPGGGGAPTSSTYVLMTADGSLPNAMVLGSLATGLLKNTTTTGVPTIATAGTDYLLPSGSGAALTGITFSQLGGSASDAQIPDNITITGLSGTNTGDVTLAGTPNYITNTGQVITRNLINLASHVTGELPGTSVGFPDINSNFAATTVAGALSELDDVINAGVPNSASAKVDWSELANVPSGFADGVDDAGAGGDADAIHDNVANEIAAIVTKTAPVGADHLLIEDSAASNVKKDITIASQETALEAVMDLDDIQGAVTDAQVPDTITVSTANAGDSASAFFTTGQIERARGGTGADTSAYGTGLLGSDVSNNTIDVDTVAELDTAIGLSGTPDSTTFLRGDGSWQVPPTTPLDIDSLPVVTTSGIDTDDKLIISADGTESGITRDDLADSIRGKKYIALWWPHAVSGGGCIKGTNDTQITWNRAIFDGTTDMGTNSCAFFISVPTDLNQSGTVRAIIKFTLNANSTGTVRWVLSVGVVPASSFVEGVPLTNAINLDFGGDGSGGTGDSESVGYTTLTGWAAAMVPDRIMKVALQRDGDSGSDTSTVGCTVLEVKLEYEPL